jgi:type II secretion system protein J
MMKTHVLQPQRLGFTLVEILIAMGILSLVCAAIFSTWMAILRANRVGLEAAATVQRARIVSHILEDSLTSAQLFTANQKYYYFVSENGRDATLSFVARLSRSFPRSGRWDGYDVRRLKFSVESGDDSSRQLVLRQAPILMDFDKEEVNAPLVLARNVREFSAQFWDPKEADWIDEWKATNSLPPMVKVTLKLDQNERTHEAFQTITRIVSIPASAVTPNWQTPRGGGSPGGPPQLPVPGVPGGPGGPGGNPGGKGGGVRLQ